MVYHHFLMKIRPQLLGIPKMGSSGNHKKLFVMFPGKINGFGGLKKTSNVQLPALRWAGELHTSSKRNVFDMTFRFRKTTVHSSSSKIIAICLLLRTFGRHDAPFSDAEMHGANPCDGTLWWLHIFGGLQNMMSLGQGGLIYSFKFHILVTTLQQAGYVSSYS